jgi:hypothetical protein
MLSYSSTIQTDLKVYNSVFITDHPLYASTIIIGDANVIPVAYPDAYNVDQNGVLTTTVENGVLSNDVDTDSLLTAELVRDVSNGNLVLNANGSFTYTPNELYYGQDSFTYKVFDRKAYSNIETVIITVNQVFTWNELITNTHEDRVVADGGTVSDKLQLNIDLDSIGEANYNNLTFLMNPNGGSKSGKIYAIKPDNGTADLTVDRNSEASYVAEDGFKFANANEPRFDWSSGKPTLLVEPQRTNLCVRSFEFLSNNWVKQDVDVSNNSITAPDGSSTATKIICTTDNQTVRLLSVGSKSDNRAIISLFFKPNEITHIKIGHTYSSIDAVTFDSTNKTFIFKGSGIGSTNYEELNNGWYRIFVECPIKASLIDIRTQNPVGLNDSFYIWGVQLEEGTEASSYIPTNGSTVTRLSDNITVNPPSGTTQIIETIDDVEQTPITTIPATYQIPEGNINQIKML